MNSECNVKTTLQDPGLGWRSQCNICWVSLVLAGARSHCLHGNIFKERSESKMEGLGVVVKPPVPAMRLQLEEKEFSDWGKKSSCKCTLCGL